MAKAGEPFTFSPEAAAENGVIQPQPSNIKLTQVPIFEKGKPEVDQDYASLGQRNAAQQENIDELKKHYEIIPAYAGGTNGMLRRMFGNSFDWTYRCYAVNIANNRGFSNQLLFQEYIYLFNVLVAFEWNPSPYNIAILERAARRAADFLFDVTEGWMTFGQVVIGGPELLDCADFQVMASNRLLPRSWVGGFHEAKKYMPIRLGRGLWQKNSRGSIPWDEPEGYRVLVHEWAHYALELLDRYTDTDSVYILEDVKATQAANEARRSNRQLVVPSISPPVESIMSTLEGTSELVAKGDAGSAQGKQSEWDVIIYGFEGLDDTKRSTKRKPRFPRITAEYPINNDEQQYPDPVEGPLPLRELPYFARVVPNKPPENEEDAPPQKEDDLWKEELLLPSLPPTIKPENCWVYILKKPSSAGIPQRIIAQGTLDARSKYGFRLFGAEQGDQIVLIGETTSWRVKVLRVTIPEPVPLIDERGRLKIPEIDKEAWVDCTPDPFPIIDVLPAEVKSAEDRTARISVQVYKPENEKLAPYPVAGIYLFPLDQVNGRVDVPIYLEDGETTKDAISLDGHVLVNLPGNKLTIATFAQGGGPPTGSPVGGTPMTPGSAEGNLLIFFADHHEYPVANQEHGLIRVITTRLPGGAPSNLPGTDTEARGYAYSLCSNDALPSEYLPTLSLFYDRRTDLQDGEAIIHRQDDDGLWKSIPSYRPGGSWFVAAPLDIKTAPRLLDPDRPQTMSRVERYRLYWVPRNAGQNSNR